MSDLVQVIEGRPVHTLFGFPGQLRWCDEYVTGDNVVGREQRDLVDCPECLDWLHS